MDTPSTTDVRGVIDHVVAKDLNSGTLVNWGTLVAVIAWTVCRRGEVAGLQWREVYLTEGSLLIRRSVTASRRLCLLSGPDGTAALQPVHDHTNVH
jgi:integrase